MLRKHTFTLGGAGVGWTLQGTFTSFSFGWGWVLGGLGKAINADVRRLSRQCQAYGDFMYVVGRYKKYCSTWNCNFTGLLYMYHASSLVLGCSPHLQMYRKRESCDLPSERAWITISFGLRRLHVRWAFELMSSWDCIYIPFKDSVDFSIGGEFELICMYRIVVECLGMLYRACLLYGLTTPTLEVVLNHCTWNSSCI